MPWSLWASNPSANDNTDDKKTTSAPKNDTRPTVSAQGWTASALETNNASTIQILAACGISVGATLLVVRTYKTYFRRIPNVSHLKPTQLRSRSIYGYVTSVGDGDNFRLFHTPGGRLAGWGWLPGRKTHLSGDRKRLQDNTIHVRIAGVDAPEASHFGRPSQPYSAEALEWLRGQVLGQYVRVWPYRKDQYERVVCTVYKYRLGLVKKDVGLDMLRNGWATVYEAKFGSEFGKKEEEYRAVEEKARQRKVGMWQQPGLIGKMFGKKGSEALESPREYKTRMKKEEGG